MRKANIKQADPKITSELKSWLRIIVNSQWPGDKADGSDKKWLGHQLGMLEAGGMTSGMMVHLHKQVQERGYVRKAEAANRAQGGASSQAPSNLDVWMHGGDWQKAAQFVKSMVCDPAQLEKLCRSAGYDGSEFLRSLAGEFKEAKAAGRKVEKHPQDWLRLEANVRQAMRGERIGSSFFKTPKAEPARADSGSETLKKRLGY